MEIIRPPLWLPGFAPLPFRPPHEWIGGVCIVYAFFLHDRERVKVGVTHFSQYETRMVRLQRYARQFGETRADHVKCAEMVKRETEQIFHRALDQWLIEGEREWFYLKGECMATLMRLNKIPVGSTPPLPPDAENITDLRAWRRARS